MDEKLIEAAELIENKFGRGKFEDRITGDLCMMGAVRKAYWGSGLRTHVDPQTAYKYDRPLLTSLERLRRVMPPCGDECDNFSQGTIGHYNDMHCDGGVTAAKLLREAAEVEL
jgi:hypothetical protein